MKKFENNIQSNNMEGKKVSKVQTFKLSNGNLFRQKEYEPPIMFIVFTFT